MRDENEIRCYSNSEEGDLLVSIIVPVFNAGEYLNQCIKSILAQTEPRFELLLMDDGSTDGSGEQCEQWAKKDRRIRVFHQKNGGQSRARNACLDQAEGQYFTFIDSDDYVTSDYLSYLLTLFKYQPEAEITACNHWIVRNGQKTINSTEKELVTVLTKRDAFEDVLYQRRMDVAVWAKLFRRSIWESIRFPEGRIFEDTWLFGDLLNQTEWIVYGNKCCYNYLIREGSTVRRKFKEDNLQYIDAAERLAEQAICCDPLLETAGIRRMNHAKLSVLRYMEHCEPIYKLIRNQLRKDILRDAPKYIYSFETPRRDWIALVALRIGFPAFYLCWKLYSMFR